MTQSRTRCYCFLADQGTHVGALVERVPYAQMAQPLDDLMEDVVVHLLVQKQLGARGARPPLVLRI